MPSLRTLPLFMGSGALALAAAVLLASGVFTSQAVQNPSISLDMVTSGNSYSDPGGGGDNSMTVGAIDGCLSTAPPGNNNNHLHTVHLVIKNVEDLVAWQARFNYIGDKMRLHSFDGVPFTDTGTTTEVGFLNLPIDPAFADHRAVIPQQNIPPPAPGPQTALIGQNRFGEDSFAISPDTPLKVPHDEPVQSYDAPNGGILASLTLDVGAGNAGQLLTMDLDDDTPNAPGSLVLVFTESGVQTIALPPSALGDGLHDEGAESCAPTPPTPTFGVCRTATPLPTPGGPTARDIIISSQAGFLNDTAQSLSDLHICFSSPYTFAQVTQNPPGCPAPVLTKDDNDMNFRLDVDWGTACFDPGESVNLRFDWICGDQFAPCNTPGVECFQWTLSGAPIGACSLLSPTPTQTPSPPPSTDCPGPDATPTPTPTAVLSFRTFTNSTGQAASDLHVRLNFPAGIFCIKSNPPGCPLPARSPAIDGYSLDWGVACVDPGESVTIADSSEPPAMVLCFDWTIFGEPIPGPGSCASPSPPPGSPTPTPTVTLFHDAAVVRLRVPRSARLTPGVPEVKNVTVIVQSRSDHPDQVGVYLAFNPPGGFGANPGGCSSFVLHVGAFFLDPGQKITANRDVELQCSDPAAVDGDNWQVLAIADVHHGTDFASCDTPEEAFDGACATAVNDDDDEDANNTKLRPLPKVVAQ